MNQDTLYFKNIEGLKAAGARMEFTREQIEELIKCRKDPLYFVEKYCKIETLDRGLVPFKMYDYQKRWVKETLDNRFFIGCMPRQSGKCVTFDTLLNIKVDGKLYSLPIGDFYEWQRFREQTRRLLEEHSLLSGEEPGR